MVLPWLTYWAMDPAKMGDDGKYFTGYDPAEAKKLLTAAGKEKFSFGMQNSNIGAYTVTYPFADLMASQLAQVGITQKQVIVDYAAHLQKWVPEVDGGVREGFIVRPDIQSYAFAQVGMSSGLSAGKPIWEALTKNDKEYQDFRVIAEKQRVTLDRNARKELVNDMQDRKSTRLNSSHT